MDNLLRLIKPNFRKVAYVILYNINPNEEIDNDNIISIQANEEYYEKCIYILNYLNIETSIYKNDNSIICCKINYTIFNSILKLLKLNDN